MANAPWTEAETVDPPGAVRKEMFALSGSKVHRLLDACEGTPWHHMFTHWFGQG